MVIAIILQALVQLGRTAHRRTLSLAIAAGVVVLALGGVEEIPLLLAGGAVVMIAANWPRMRRPTAASILAPLAPVGLSLTAVSFSLPLLFLTFFKIGAVLYGSGYVLFAFLQTDLVERLGWLTPSQLVDAVAIGQITPGPLFTSATFIGYLLAGPLGAIVPTSGSSFRPSSSSPQPRR